MTGGRGVLLALALVAAVLAPTGAAGAGTTAAASDGAVPGGAALDAAVAAARSEVVDAQILGIPGGFVAAGNYGTPVAVMTQGAGATFANYDIALHDVVATDARPDGRPIFKSKLVGLNASTAVEGVESLAPGSYGYYCSLHAWMTGTLQVVGTPGGEEPAPTPPATWPSYGGDLANSRSNDDGPAPLDAPQLAPAWTYELPGGGDFQGTPVVGDGAVFMGSVLGRVVAVDVGTGAERWQVDLTREGEVAEVTATAAYADGEVYVPVSAKQDGRYTPYVVALDSATGAELWRTYVDPEQPLGDVQGSPVVWETEVDGEPWRTLYIGTASYDSGAVGRGHLHLGTLVALDLDDRGALRWRTYMHEGSPRTQAEIPLQPDGNPVNGAGVWSTPSIDTATGELFVGTGQGYTTWHALTNSLVRVDAFTGEIEDSYQATRNDRWSINNPQNGPDADFGASPQLITGPDGQRWLGGGQKNNHVVDEVTGQMEPHAMVGVARYHVVDRETMEPVWVTPVGPGYWLGGITGSTAYDGEHVYGSTVFGELFSLDAATGLPRWVVPTGDAAHFAPTTESNGVVYSATATGTLTAWSAEAGAPLFTARIGLPSFGGVAVVDGLVVVAQGFSGTDGSIHAFRVPG